MAVARTEFNPISNVVTVEPLSSGESYAGYFLRIGGEANEERLQTLDALERIRRSWSLLPGGVSSIEDTTELIRRGREDRDDQPVSQ